VHSENSLLEQDRLHIWHPYSTTQAETPIYLVKSAQGAIITLMDITGVARFVAAQTFAFYELFITAAVFYLILVYGLLFVFKKIEYRLSAHLRARES